MGRFATAIEDDAERGFSLETFPNPTTGDVTLRLRAQVPGRLAVSVVDVLGREVWGRQSLSVSVGSTTVSVPMASLSAGVYVVRASLDGRPLQSALVTKR